MLTDIKEEGNKSVNKLTSKNYQVYVIEDSTPPINFPQS